MCFGKKSDALEVFTGTVDDLPSYDAIFSFASVSISLVFNGRRTFRSETEKVNMGAYRKTD